MRLSAKSQLCADAVDLCDGSWFLDAAVIKLNVIAEALTWNKAEHWAISSLSRQTVPTNKLHTHVSRGPLQTLSHLSSQPDWPYLGSSLSTMENYHIKEFHVSCRYSVCVPGHVCILQI